MAELKPPKQAGFTAASNERVQPQDGLSYHWVTLGETEALLNGGQIEPNATTLLNEYLPRMAA